MKRFFNVMLVVLLIAAFSAPAFAGHGCKGHKGDCCAMMKKELKLTDKQQAQIDKLKKECLELKKKLHEKVVKLGQKKCELAKAKKADKAAIHKLIDKKAKLHAELEKLMVDCKAKIKALLTPEQQKKMEALHAKCKTAGKACCPKAKAHCAKKKECCKKGVKCDKKKECCKKAAKCDKKKPCCKKDKKEVKVKKVAKAEGKKACTPLPGCPKDCKHIKKTK